MTFGQQMSGMFGREEGSPSKRRRPVKYICTVMNEQGPIGNDHIIIVTDGRAPTGNCPYHPLGTPKVKYVKMTDEWRQKWDAK